MFKKILTSSILFIGLFGSAQAFLGSQTSLDLYKDIEAGMKDLKLKNFEYEMTSGGSSITEEINDILVINGLKGCMKNTLTTSDIGKIVSGNLSFIIINLKNEEGCIYEEAIGTNQIKEIEKIIKDVYKTKTLIANEKADTIYKISSIGIYSDGDTNNSSFDLITDMEEIDKIIFSEEIIYEGEMTGDNYKNFTDFLAGNLILPTKSPPSTTTTITSSGITTTTTSSGVTTTTTTPPKTTTSSTTTSTSISLPFLDDGSSSAYVCVKSNDSSGFSEETLKSLTTSSTGSTTSSGSTSTSTSSSTSSTTTTSSSTTSTTTSSTSSSKSKISSSPYVGVNDNSIWPCNSFFCITIKLKTYTEGLKGGKTFSIESYLNTSNGHLRKFSATSLVQSKMTINNFEIGLRDLNLSDSFHMGLLIVKKAPPILKLENKSSTKVDDQYKEILREYYKNAGLNYDKKNSLYMFRDKENEYRTIATSAELSITAAEESDRQLKQKQKRDKEINKELSKEFDMKILSDDMKNFSDKFVLLESFTNNIYDYSKNALGIIKKMNEIPIKE